MSLSSLFYVALVALLTATAAVIDVRTRRLPNWLTLSALAAAVLLHTLIQGVSGLGFALIGLLAGGGVLLVLWLIGGAGGGDVKLMGALGAWLGVTLMFYVFLVSTAVAAVAIIVLPAVGLLSRGSADTKRRRRTSRSASRPASRKKTEPENAQRLPLFGGLIPYAVPVAFGTWVVLAFAWRFNSLPW